MFRDNESCIKVLLNPNSTGLTDLNESESNLIVAIRRLLPKFYNLYLAHIYVHLDDDVPMSKLPFEAQINI